MDSPGEFSDSGLNPRRSMQTPEEDGNGKVVHYFGTAGAAAADAGAASSHRHRCPHHKADALLLLLRFVTFAFSLASVLLMVTDHHSLRARGDTRIRWFNFDAFRYVLAASLIVCIYSLAEIGLGIWYLCVGRMLMPDSLAHWFDFGHDQGFAYLIFSACSAGTTVAHNLRDGQMFLRGSYSCDDAPSFCTQAEISIGLGFGAFLFIALSSLLSGFRLSRWLTGSL